MNNWFTVEQIDKDTYVISEYKHWEETHCYLLLGMEKCLLIDTGLGVSDISAVVKTITKLPVEVATTHVHWDHIGGHKYFKNIAVHEYEKEWLTSKIPIPLPVVKENLLRDPCEFPENFNIQEYCIYQGEPTGILKDNDLIQLGGREVQVIHTPGHSPGHICFYEKDREYLYSGDLIYEGMLYVFYPTTDPFDFMQSIIKVRKLPTKKVLPGHHNLNIQVELIKGIEEGFLEIERMGKLKQGNGIFQFEHFGIQI